MAQIDRTGTFRFQIVESGIKSKENSNVVQWAAKLLATEYYDAETEQWIDWSQYDEREIDCYLTLYGKDKQPIFHVNQLQKAVGWSGADFSELDTEYLGDVVFQGYVDENTYEGKTSLRVARIDTYDAEPGNTLQKLDKDELKKLNAKFASQLRELSGGNKPKSVNKSVDKKAAKEAAKQRMADRKAKGKAAEEKAAKIEPPKPPKPPKLPTPPTSVQEAMNKGQAWIDCCQERPETVTDEQLENAWHAAIDKLGGEDAVDANNQWAEVRDKVFAAFVALEIPF